VKNIPQIFRIHIQVKDLKEAAAFYAKLLGIEGRLLPGARHYFDCGSVILGLLGRGDDALPMPDILYFSVTDIEAVHARAKKLGCLSKESVHDEPGGEIVARPWGERSFYAVDSCGNELCFVDAGTVYSGRR